MILNTTDSLKALCENMENHNRVFYSRYGDVDLYMMMGHDSAGRELTIAYGGNKTVFSEKLQKEMLNAFKINHPQYMIAMTGDYQVEEGMKRGVFAPFPDKKWIETSANLLAGRRDYYSHIIFHYLCVFKTRVFFDFIEKYVKPKKKLYIGSVPKEAAEKIVGHIDYHVSTPDETAYNSIDDWWKEVEQVIDKVEMVIPSAGQSSRVINGRLWDMGVNVQSMDIGSVFDVVYRPTTRTWLREEGHRVLDFINKVDKTKFYFSDDRKTIRVFDGAEWVEYKQNETAPRH